MAKDNAKKKVKRLAQRVDQLEKKLAALRSPSAKGQKPPAGEKKETDASEECVTYFGTYTGEAGPISRAKVAVQRALGGGALADTQTDDKGRFKVCAKRADDELEIKAGLTKPHVILEVRECPAPPDPFETEPVCSECLMTIEGLITRETEAIVIEAAYDPCAKPCTCDGPDPKDDGSDDSGQDDDVEDDDVEDDDVEDDDLEDDADDGTSDSVDDRDAQPDPDSKPGTVDMTGWEDRWRTLDPRIVAPAPGCDPAGGLQVSLVDSDGDVLAICPTQKSGMFRFTISKCGIYRVEWPDEIRDGARRWSLSGQSRARTFVVSELRTGTFRIPDRQIPIYALALGKVRGKLVCTDCQPIANETVTIRQEIGKQVADFAAVTNSFGEFECARLAPGRFSVVAPSSIRVGSDSYTIVAQKSLSASLRSGESHVISDIVYSRERYFISHTVTDPDGQPLADVDVEVWDAILNRPIPTRFRTGPGGKVELDLPGPGKYYVLTTDPFLRGAKRSLLMEVARGR